MSVAPARRHSFPIFALFSALLLTAAGLAAMFLPPAAKVENPSVAQRGDWEIRRCAVPEGAAAPVSRDALLRGTLMLVSPAHPLPSDYPPPSTRGIRAMVGSYLNAEDRAALCREVIYALSRMEFDGGWSQGARVTEGALSAAQIEEKRREALQRYSGIYPLAQALDLALAAAPGGQESEHRTGYALDIALEGPLAMGRSDPLLRNETGVWLSENMARYGFIRRYHEDSEEGNCEGIHLRYVGPVHALAMETLDMTLEAYLRFLRQTGCVALCREGEIWAYILCRPEQEADAFPLPPGASLEVSGDNAGYAVGAVTVKPFW